MRLIWSTFTLVGAAYSALIQNKEMLYGMLLVIAWTIMLYVIRSERV